MQSALMQSALIQSAFSEQRRAPPSHPQSRAKYNHAPTLIVFSSHWKQTQPLAETATTATMKPLHKTAARFALPAALIIFAWPSPHARAQRMNPTAAAAARQAAEGFYRYHFARDRGFLRSNVVRRRRWLSPELYRLMLNEFRREAAFRKAQPDEVPFMTGDPFTDSQEYPDTFSVGRASVRGSTASVPVTFRWRGVARTKTLQVELLRQGGRWLIHDMRREGDTGLLKLLRRPVYESGSQ